MKPEIFYPKIAESGVYDGSKFRASGVITPERVTRYFELELPTVEGGTSYINGNEYPILCDRLINIRPDTHRCSLMPYSCKFIKFELTGGFLYDYLCGLDCVINMSDPPEFNRLFDSIISLHATPHSGSELLLQSKLLELIYLMGRCNGLSRSRGGLNPIVSKVSEYIDSHIQENPSLDEMALNLNVNPIYMHRLFSATMGKSPHRYLLEKKLALAKQLLLSTDKSCAEIALETGFSSQSYFNYTFRREEGVTPAEFVRNWYESHSV